MSSDRKGGAHKKTRKTVWVSESHNEKLIALAQSAKKPTMTKRDLAEYLIDLCDEFHFEKTGWRARFNEGLDKIDKRRREEREDIPEDACPALQRVNDIIHCIWAQKNAPPKVRKLSPDLHEALKACLGCARTREILDGIAGYEETIRNLKERVKRGIVATIPRCVYPETPGVLSSDGLSFWCRMGSQNIKVKQCNKLRNGQPCRYLEWMKVQVKGDLPDLEK